jgi:hypothetical protein
MAASFSQHRGPPILAPPPTIPAAAPHPSSNAPHPSSARSAAPIPASPRPHRVSKASASAPLLTRPPPPSQLRPYTPPVQGERLQGERLRPYTPPLELVKGSLPVGWRPERKIPSAELLRCFLRAGCAGGRFPGRPSPMRSPGRARAWMARVYFHAWYRRGLGVDVYTLVYTSHWEPISDIHRVYLQYTSVYTFH